MAPIGRDTIPRMENWTIRFENELQAAREARARQNEGRARVCARRAVGALLDGYFAARGIPFDRPSAYDKVRFFVTLEDVPTEVRQVAEHFLRRVTPEFKLPIEADLIAEARWLREQLTGTPMDTDEHR